MNKAAGVSADAAPAVVLLSACDVRRSHYSPASSTRRESETLTMSSTIATAQIVPRPTASVDPLGSVAAWAWRYEHGHGGDGARVLATLGELTALPLADAIRWLELARPLIQDPDALGVLDAMLASWRGALARPDADALWAVCRHQHEHAADTVEQRAQRAADRAAARGDADGAQRALGRVVTARARRMVAHHVEPTESQPRAMRRSARGPRSRPRPRATATAGPEPPPAEPPTTTMASLRPFACALADLLIADLERDPKGKG